MRGHIFFILQLSFEVFQSVLESATYDSVMPRILASTSEKRPQANLWNFGFTQLKGLRKFKKHGVTTITANDGSSLCQCGHIRLRRRLSRPSCSDISLKTSPFHHTILLSQYRSIIIYHNPYPQINIVYHTTQTTSFFNLQVICTYHSSKLDFVGVCHL